MKVTLIGEVDRPTVSWEADTHPDTVIITTLDPSLEGILEVVERFVWAMGFHPPDGKLDYVPDEGEDL